MKTNFEFSLVEDRIETVIANNSRKFIGRLMNYTELAEKRFSCSEERAIELALKKLVTELYRGVASDPAVYLTQRAYGAILSPVAEEIIEIRNDGLDEIWSIMANIWRLKRYSRKAPLSGEFDVEFFNTRMLKNMSKLRRAEANTIGFSQALSECFRNYEGEISEANSIKGDGVIGDFDQDDIDDYIDSSWEKDEFPQEEEESSKYLGRFLATQNFLQKKLDNCNSYDTYNRKIYEEWLDEVKDFVETNLSILVGENNERASRGEILRDLHKFDGATTINKEALKEALDKAESLKPGEKTPAQLAVEQMRLTAIGVENITINIIEKDESPYNGVCVVENTKLPTTAAKLHKKAVGKLPKPIKEQKKVRETFSAAEWEAVAAEAREDSAAEYYRDLKSLENRVLKLQKKLDETEYFGSREDVRRASRELSEAKAELIRFKERHSSPWMK